METLTQPYAFENQSEMIDFDAEFAAMMEANGMGPAAAEAHQEQAPQVDNPLTEAEINDFVAALNTGVGLSEYDQNFLNEAGIAAGPVPEQQQADAMRSLFDTDDNEKEDAR